MSVSPSASRSAPAQAIIAPLSVHSSGGGTTSTVPNSKASRCRIFRIASLAATPPAATSEEGMPKVSRNMRRPQRRRSATTSTTACWNAAHKSATSSSVSGAIFSASSRSAVFRPESEKSTRSAQSSAAAA